MIFKGSIFKKKKKSKIEFVQSTTSIQDFQHRCVNPLSSKQGNGCRLDIPPSPNNNVSLSFHKKRRKEKKKKAVIHGSSPFFSTDRVTDRGWRTMGGGQWASFKSDIMSSKTGRRQTATGRNRAEYCKYSGWALFPVYREATMGDKLHACSVGNTSLGRRTDPLLLSMHHGRIYP